MMHPSIMDSGGLFGVEALAWENIKILPQAQRSQRESLFSKDSFQILKTV
jgi:hypothetical protein